MSDYMTLVRFKSLKSRDFENGAVRDELCGSVKRMEDLSKRLQKTRKQLNGSRKFADGLITEQTKLQTDLGNQSRTLAAVRGVRRNRLYVLYRDYDRRKFYVSADELDKALKES